LRAAKKKVAYLTRVRNFRDCNLLRERCRKRDRGKREIAMQRRMAAKWNKRRLD
jgi:hypothetical protein